MPTPPNGEISMEDINLELDLFTPSSNLDLKNDFYLTSQNSGGAALMYHNLSMATNNATTAKVAIYDPYNANANMTISNWYNYTRDAEVVMTYSIENNGTGDDFTITVAIIDSTGANVGIIFSGVVQNNTTESGTSVGPSALGTIGSAGYKIIIDQFDFFLAPGTSNTATFTITASDTDGVGAATTRTVITPAAFTQSYIPPAPPGPPFPTNTVIVNTSGGEIAINKRTTVSIVIT